MAESVFGMAGRSLEDMVGEVLREMNFTVRRGRTAAEGDLVVSTARGDSVGLLLDIRRYEGLDSAFIRNMQACRAAAKDLTGHSPGWRRGRALSAALALRDSAVAVLCGPALTAVVPILGIRYLSRWLSILTTRSG